MHRAIGFDFLTKLIFYIKMGWSRCTYFSEWNVWANTMRLGRHIQNFALLGFGLMLGLASTEAMSRILYTKPWYEKLNDAALGSDWEYFLKRNSLGLRGPEPSGRGSAEKRRILVLGDSFTFGLGVPDDSAIFTQILERRLNGDHPVRGRAVEILNGGLPGSLTGDWVELLDRLKDTFRPDVILVVFFLRDGTRTSSMGSFFQPIRTEIVAENQRSFVYRHAYLYRLWKDVRDRRRISASYSKAIRDAYLGTRAETREWRLAKRNLLTIRTIARELHATLALAVFPVLVQLDRDYPFGSVCNTIARFGETNGIPTLDLLPAFLGKNASELWVSTLDQHPNARGHRIAADALFPFLQGLLREPEPASRLALTNR